MSSYIYALVHPVTNDIRYIGKSYNPKRRLQEHLSTKELSNRTHKSNWLKSLLTKGLKPRLKIVATIPEIDWEGWERYYINYYRDSGYKLTNQGDGGLGGFKGRLPWNTGKKLSEEHKRKIGLGSLGNKSKLGQKASVETRKKLSLVNLGKKRTKETKLKLSLLKQGKTRRNDRKFKQS